MGISSSEKLVLMTRWCRLVEIWASDCAWENRLEGDDACCGEVEREMICYGFTQKRSATGVCELNGPGIR